MAQAPTRRVVTVPLDCDQLVYAMQVRGLTVAALAAGIGVNKATIHRGLTGERVRPAVAAAIAAYFSANPPDEELMALVPAPKKARS